MPPIKQSTTALQQGIVVSTVRALVGLEALVSPLTVHLRLGDMVQLESALA